MEPAEIIEDESGWTCEIHWDTEPSSPDDWDQLATFEHGTNYTFGTSYTPTVDWRWKHDSWAIYARGLAIFGDDVAAVLPIQITEHGPQVTISDCLSAPEVANGVFYTTHKRLNELCGEDAKYHTREWALDALRSELSEWRQYLEGDVYGIVVKRPDGEVAESVWGFYGLEYAVEEGREMLDAEIKAEANAIEQTSRIVSL